MAGLAGGAASLVSQLFLRTTLDLGPRLSDLYPELFGRLTGWDVFIYCLFILAEGALVGYLYAHLQHRLPGGGWLKGLVFGAGLWIAVNLLPLVGLSALFQGPAEGELTLWSLTWLGLILIQSWVTALFFQVLTSPGNRRGDE
ncbi:MAG: hypothetical protein NTW26_09485 [bacterium]|nr:hypothetical protein [bacterium]